MSNIDNVLENINNSAVTDANEFIASYERRYKNIVAETVRKISEEPNKEIVMLAGPSASGKTTTANKLRENFEKLGHKAYVISLDDFYGDKRFAPKFPDGSPNYETIYALDIELIGKTLNQLLKEGECEIPIFDFSIGRRREETKHIHLEKGDVIIVEGLHALNPLITDMFPPERIVKLYVNVSTRIYDEKGNIVLSKRNVRFLRRMIRDYRFRDSDIRNTYKLWQGVQTGEGEYLFPFRHLADYRINSIHTYELCIYKDIAIKMLEEIKKDEEYYRDARGLIRSLNKFESLSVALVPKDSLLREFLGD